MLVDSTQRLLVSETPILRPGRRLDFFTLTGDQPCGQVLLRVAYVPWAVERCPGLEAGAPGGALAMMIPRGKKVPEEAVQCSVLSLTHSLGGSSLSAFSVIYGKWLRRPFRSWAFLPPVL